MSVLDFKLGFRMLMRYPGLTVLGGLAIAFAICAGAGTFEFLTQVGAPKLPFRGGDRLVALELVDTRQAWRLPARAVRRGRVAGPAHHRGGGRRVPDV
jgi:hypothetical protein